MAKAYILVKTEIGSVERTKTALQRLPGVTAVDIVSGDCDLVVLAEAATAQELGRLVMREIHGAPGVAQTTTYVVIG